MGQVKEGNAVLTKDTIHFFFASVVTAHPDCYPEPQHIPTFCIYTGAFSALQFITYFFFFLFSFVFLNFHFILPQHLGYLLVGGWVHGGGGRGKKKKWKKERIV